VDRKSTKLIENTSKKSINELNYDSGMGSQLSEAILIPSIHVTRCPVHGETKSPLLKHRSRAPISEDLDTKSLSNTQHSNMSPYAPDRVVFKPRLTVSRKRETEYRKIKTRINQAKETKGEPIVLSALESG
jgi:hypothetical protein